MKQTKKAVLLVNLGSPDSTHVKDVYQYLKEFLSDPRVIDSSPLARWIVVNCFILPFRPKNTAHAYSQIWTKEGSPLILTSQNVQSDVAKQINIPIYLAMRYGNPSIAYTLNELQKEGITDLYVIPLYPHYAMSSYETAVVAVEEAITQHQWGLTAHFLQPFYKDPEYIEALVKSAQPYLEEDFDLLLFSFHGIPRRHLEKSDPSKAHCLKVKNCCQKTNPSNATCYKHQCLETVRHFVQKANLPPEKYFVSYQSRLGRDPWLEPYTDKTLEQLPQKGIKKLLVICPAFVSDCLETLEEIAMSGKEAFLSAGGETFSQIPCLNTHPAWINFLSNKINTWVNIN